MSEKQPRGYLLASYEATDGGPLEQCLNEWTRVWSERDEGTLPAGAQLIFEVCPSRVSTVEVRVRIVPEEEQWA